MADPLWQTNLVPASFNGVGFYVEVQGRVGGGRIVPHEFPKKDIPWAEPMGRKIRHWSITGYLIYNPSRMPDVFGQRDILIAALEAGATTPGVLVLPTGLQNMSDEPPGAVLVDTYSVIERREAGGHVEFEMLFIEAGQTVSSAPVTDTASKTSSAAQSLISTAPTSTDITSPWATQGTVNLGGGSPSVLQGPGGPNPTFGPAVQTVSNATDYSP